MHNDDQVWNRYPLCMSCILLAVTYIIQWFKTKIACVKLSNLTVDVFSQSTSDCGSINCSVIQEQIYHSSPVASSTWVIQRSLIKYYNGEKANTIHQFQSITDKGSLCPIFEDLKFVVEPNRNVSALTHETVVTYNCQRIWGLFIWLTSSKLF